MFNKRSRNQQTKLVTERIFSFNQSRNPDLIYYKYDAMRENVYRFFRATCHLFYEDLAAAGLMIKSPEAWICGDLHLENFGSYKSCNGQVYFDLNDFDEAVLAPAHWEPLRLISSIYVAFDHLRIERKKADRIAQKFLDRYASTLAEGKPVYVERNVAKGIVCEFLTKVRTRRHRDIVKKRTTLKHGKLKLRIDNKKQFPIEEQLKNELIPAFNSWLRENEETPYNYTAVDAAFRKAGTSSLGLDRYVLLLESTNKTGAAHLIVDIKEAAPSSLVSVLQNKQPEWLNEAERITMVQKLVQQNVPYMFTSMEFNNKHFIVQELQPAKDNIDFNLIAERYRDMSEVINVMATLCASAQLRAAGRKGATGPEELIAFGNANDWQKPLLEYAKTYHNTLLEYFESFRKAMKMAA